MIITQCAPDSGQVDAPLLPHSGRAFGLVAAFPFVQAGARAVGASEAIAGETWPTFAYISAGRVLARRQLVTRRWRL